MLILLLLFFPCAWVYAQNGSDTLRTDLDSLMSIKISRDSYIDAASKYAQPLNETPTSITIVNSKTSETFGYNSLMDLLRSARGFYISNDRQYEALGVRGFNRPNNFNNKVLLLLNGHRLNIYDGAPLGNDLGLDMFNLEKVEIIRGPGSALYGANAMLSVINLIPKKTGSLKDFQFIARYGSNETKKFAFNWGGEILKDLSFSLNSSFYDSKGEDIYFKEFDSKENNNGLAVGLDYESHFGLNGSLNYKNFSINAFSSSRTKGNPTGSFFSKYNEKSETTNDYKFIELNYSAQISYDKFLSFKTFYDYYNNLGKYYIQMFWIDDEGYAENNVKTVGSEIQFIWDLFPNNRLTTGIEYRQEIEKTIHVWTSGITVLDDKSPTQIFSIYIQDEFQLTNNFSFYSGLREDIYNPGQASLNPRISINYQPSDRHVLRLLYGTAFREPNIYERFYQIPFFYIKNPNLKPESIKTTELVWEYNFSKALKSILSFYYYKMTDLIEVATLQSDQLYQYKNIGSAETKGIEIEFGANLYKDSEGYLRYSYQKATDENGSALSNSPEHLLKFGISYLIAKPLKFAFELQLESGRKTIYSNTTKPVLYSTINLSTGKFLDHFRFSVLVKNLFNSPIYYPGGFQLKQDYIPQLGRNFILSLEYGLD